MNGIRNFISIDLLFFGGYFFLVRKDLTDSVWQIEKCLEDTAGSRYIEGWFRKEPNRWKCKALLVG